jgi:hypothetical protein
MSEEREPDHAEDPRGADTGQGLPEQQPGDASPSEGGEKHGRQAHDEETAQSGAGGPSGGRDEDAGTATGNPGAAGS